MTEKKKIGVEMFVVVLNTEYMRIGRTAMRNTNKRWVADWVVDVITKGDEIESQAYFKEEDLVPIFRIPVEARGLSLKAAISRYHQEIIDELIEFLEITKEIARILSKKQLL